MWCERSHASRRCLIAQDNYHRVERNDTPEIYLREIAHGRVAYIPWELDRVFWEVLAPDHGLLWSWLMSDVLNH